MAKEEKEAEGLADLPFFFCPNPSPKAVAGGCEQQKRIKQEEKGYRQGNTNGEKRHKQVDWDKEQLDPQIPPGQILRFLGKKISA